MVFFLTQLGGRKSFNLHLYLQIQGAVWHCVSLKYFSLFYVSHLHLLVKANQN